MDAVGHHAEDRIGVSEQRAECDDYLEESFAAAGVTASEVTHVVLTHIDFDHSGGLVDGATTDAYRPALKGFSQQVLIPSVSAVTNRDPLHGSRDY